MKGKKEKESKEGEREVPKGIQSTPTMIAMGNVA